MKMTDILKRANRFYPDGDLALYWDENGDFVDNPDGGDSLARAIVSCLTEDWAGDITEENAGEIIQIAGAKVVIIDMIANLSAVLAGLEGYSTYGEIYQNNDKE